MKKINFKLLLGSLVASAFMILIFNLLAEEVIDRIVDSLDIEVIKKELWKGFL